MTNSFSDKLLASVAHISTGVNLPEDAILPNARQGITRRKVLLKRGSSSNKGDNNFIQEEGQLRYENKWHSYDLLFFQLRDGRIRCFLSHIKTVSSLQIIFVYKQVICQARVKFWPDKKPVWSDKKNL